MSQESAMLDELMAKYAGMSDEKKSEMDKLISERSDNRLWFPTIGPQLDAVNCKADIMLYGGSGGCGKTDLICGLAFESHKRSLVIRKHYTAFSSKTR
jgi:predicted ATPase